MSSSGSCYVAGRWEIPADGAVITVENPATLQTLATIRSAGPDDVDRAVGAAHRAAAAWSRTGAAERAQLLDRLADELQRRHDPMVATIVSDVGCPVRTADRIQARLPVTIVRSYAELLRAAPAEERIGNSLVVRQPVGVVAAITPWNYPLHQIICKLAPALAAGATVVLKPSEVAPLVTYPLVEAIEAAGIPPGVVNVVHGSGPEVGAALADHPGVDMVSFTGSVAAGASVGQLAAKRIKRLTLELGGKSANVVLDDADLARAVKVGVANAFLNAGQTCTAWTRLLVPQSRHEEALELAAVQAAAFEPGDPSDPATRLGPLVSATQRERVWGYVSGAIADGARLAAGGLGAPAGLERGHYVRPTVFGDVDPGSTLAQEEVFGPVLAVIPYRDDDDAERIANGTRYGLHGCVWSADPDRALAFARRLRTGQVDVNGGSFNPLAPFGGVRMSGVGRELGRYGLEEFTEVTSIQL